MNIAIIGGGIAGLGAGYRLQQEGLKPVVFEKGEGDRTGSDSVKGFIIDKGAYTIPESHSTFLTLIGQLGLSGQLRETPATSSTFVDGEEHRIKVGSPQDFLKYRILNFKNKKDLAKLYLYARSLGKSLSLQQPTPKTLELEQETVSDYLLREYSQDILEKIAYPLFADLFLGIPEENSKAAFLATLPNLTRFRIFTLNQGMGTVTEKLRERLEIRDHTPVLGIQKIGKSSYQIETGGKTPDPRRFEKIIFAVPLPAIPTLIADLPESLKRDLKKVRYNPSLVVALALTRPFVDHSFMNTFLRTQISTLATVVQDQEKGEGRIPKGKGLATVILTKEASIRFYDKTDDEVTESVLREMDWLWPGLSGEVLFARVYRWPFGGVQLPPGTLARQIGIREALETLDPNWAFAGDGLYRASMEVSLRTGIKAAEQILKDS